LRSIRPIVGKPAHHLVERASGEALFRVFDIVKKMRVVLNSAGNRCNGARISLGIRRGRIKKRLSEVILHICSACEIAHQSLTVV
jgi:hypothetical protein